MDFPAYTDERRQLQVNWDLVNAYLSRWKPKSFFNISITKKQRKDSDPQRGYYFSTVLRKFAEHQGYDKHEEMRFHDQLKGIYFKIKPDKFGVYRNLPHVFHKGKSKLNVPQKQAFVEWVKRLGAREGVYIPDPNERNAE